MQSDMASDIEKLHGEIFLEDNIVEADPEYHDRVAPPRMKTVKRVRMVYFALVFCTLFLAVHKFNCAVSVKHSLVDLHQYMQPLSESEADIAKIDCETLAEPTQACQVKAQMIYKAQVRRAGTQATLEFSNLADSIAASLFFITSAASILMTYYRTCGMKNAEFRGMAICTLICLAMTFSAIGAIIGSTIYLDKRAELEALPFFDQPWVLVEMGRLIWMEAIGCVLTCLSNILLGALAVYYADEFTGDSLYLPVKSKRQPGAQFWMSLY